MVCKDCLNPSSPGDNKELTIYCTDDCAALDFQRHRETTHPSRETWIGGDQVVYEEGSDRTIYRAQDILDHVSSFVDEMRRLKEELGMGGGQDIKMR